MSGSGGGKPGGGDNRLEKIPNSIWESFCKKDIVVVPNTTLKPGQAFLTSDLNDPRKTVIITNMGEGEVHINSKGVKMKTVVLLGGGDWTDASVDLLDIPEDMDVEVIKNEWRTWYNVEYLPKFRSGNAIQYKSIIDFLLEKGAKRSDIERYEI